MSRTEPKVRHPDAAVDARKELLALVAAMRRLAMEGRVVLTAIGVAPGIPAAVESAEAYAVCYVASERPTR